MDERLLRALDRDREVKRDGRSAVMRRAIAEYLRAKRRREIADAYAKAYGSGEAFEDEFAGWEDQGSWPEK